MEPGMSRKRLEEYKSNIKEIKELEYKLAHLGSNKSLIGSDTILDYRTGYPRAQSIVGYEFERARRLKASWEKRLKYLYHECMEIEKWIEDIPDSLTRRIFRMYYIDGRTQKETGKAVNLDRSCISRKIDDYIKVAHKTHETQL